MGEHIQKIHELIEKHITNDGGVVCDEGKDGDFRYTYVDTTDGEISDINHDKVVFLNDVMNIFNSILYYSNFEGPIETVDEYINCSEFICKPGCKCGKWDLEPYVQEENYMDCPSRAVVQKSSVESIVEGMDEMDIN